eukprot:Hpha_TRINITY_DN7181_c0_g2::TRINITY_DN7181_c0_g2_i1::g.29787::m.29787
MGQLLRDDSLQEGIEKAADFRTVQAQVSSGERKYRKVIFLDIDGVMHPLGTDFLPSEASPADLMARVEAGEWGRVVPGEFLPRCLAELRRVVMESEARLVLSSTWRETQEQRDAVNAQLAAAGFAEGCLSTTPCLSWDLGEDDASGGHSVSDVVHAGPGHRRAGEIVAWLVAAGGVERYVVLDDQ